MSRWIVFDEQSARALPKRARKNAELGAGDAFDLALATDTPAMLILPGEAGEVQVLTLRRDQPAATAEPEPFAPELALEPEPAAEPEFSPEPELTAEPEPQPERQPRFVAGGFLGLSDELADEAEPEPPKSWWRRLWN